MNKSQKEDIMKINSMRILGLNPKFIEILIKYTNEHHMAENTLVCTTSKRE